MVGREDPRVTRSRRAVLDAAAAALVEAGSAGVTMEGVAERAGVAKTTLYRLWPDRDELLVAAAEHLMPKKTPLVASGDVRADLLAQARGLMRALRSEDWGRGLAALIDRAEREPVMDTLCRQLSERRRAALHEFLAAEIDAGRLRHDADPELLSTQLVGALFYRRFFVRKPLGDAALVALVDHVLAPVLP